ncbi:hypothetical protein [Gluconobacter cerinus]|uniref:hypothetical protein n=1 Tax=Gluconobacter cerinus TaxID=38307 RepID=UPI001B8BDC1B|nr:hypothetical protein [Gluconobacter cerinus]MBS1035396.1 hypothetical protein [Gluconobacter cerinus]
MGKIRGVARPLPIQWVTIEAWCEANDLPSEERVWLLFQVRAMDAVFVRHRNAKITAEVASFMRG